MFRIITLSELLKELDKYNYNELHVHHTYIPSHKDFNGLNHIKLQEAMKNYHVGTNGWDDIAQHVTLTPDGKFVTGRDFGKTPISIKGFNTGSFACEMIGNFDIGHDKLEGAQLESIVGLAKYFDKKKRYIRFHRENSPKTCPGTSIDKVRFMNLVTMPEAVLAPVNTYSSELLEATKFVKDNGISDGTNPKDPVTREQMWVMLNRFNKKFNK